MKLLKLEDKERAYIAIPANKVLKVTRTEIIQKGYVLYEVKVEER